MRPRIPFPEVGQDALKFAIGSTPWFVGVHLRIAPPGVVMPSTSIGLDRWWLSGILVYDSFDEKLVDELIEDELSNINKRFSAWRERTGDKSLDHVSLENAANIFKDMITKDNLDNFLTLSLYEKI